MRTGLFGLCLFLVSASGLGQSTATESQGMQALVAEVRQLRMDLKTSNGYALKAQILLYRLQLQEGTVAHVSQRVNDLRAVVAQAQNHRRSIAAMLKQNEDLVENSDTPQELRQTAQQEISRLKPEVESLAADEQQRESEKMEAEEQLRTEQAKLNELEDRVDRLEKALDSTPH